METLAPTQVIPKLQLESLEVDDDEVEGRAGPADITPRLWGIPLKYLSLVTLAIQNASLTIIMHYSRTSTLPSHTYSAASAVLLNEVLKGSISLAIASYRTRVFPGSTEHTSRGPTPYRRGTLSMQSSSSFNPKSFFSRSHKLGKEIFSPDCWKLSIPAILYVIQNNLQFVAASNLEPSTFQVSYQMKILTTAAFSVLLLRKQISRRKWLALFALALGVGIVQIQNGGGNGHSDDKHAHILHPLKGFLAVAAACFTSGLAGVYFEMVLKNSQADLWVRNVQLSLFSLIPALLPVLATHAPDGKTSWFASVFANFGAWAWATVAVQVFGGLVTAIVIKYADNILKSFATSLSIVISFCASVALFNFHITPSFVVGSSTVLASTWLYNRPDSGKNELSSTTATVKSLVAGVMTPSSRRSSYIGSPVDSDEPILGESPDKRRTSIGGASPRMLASALKLLAPSDSLDNIAGHNESADEVSIPLLSRNQSSASIGYSSSPYLSRSHSPAPLLQGSIGTRTPPIALGYSASATASRVHSNAQLSVPQVQTRPGGLYYPEGSAGEISLDDVSVSNIR